MLQRSLGGSFDELFHAGCLQAGSPRHNSPAEAIDEFAPALLQRMLRSHGDPCHDCGALRGCRAHQIYHVNPCPIGSVPATV